MKYNRRGMRVPGLISTPDVQRRIILAQKEFSGSLKEIPPKTNIKT
jgi:hypothetical protein